MNVWELPTALSIGGKMQPIHTDYRDVLDIISHLQAPDDSEPERWYIAMALFYEHFASIAPEDYRGAMQALADFIACGHEEEQGPPSPRLLDWEKDVGMIAAGVNKVAGREVRALPYLHWWTFIAYFNGIGEGQLSNVVAIRSKLAKHKPLEKWEQEYYRSHRAEVDLEPRYSAEEQAERERLEKLLDG